MRTLRVGVTGINAGDNPGPGIGIARSLKDAADLNIEIVGLAYDAMDSGNYMNWVIDKSFTMPYPHHGGDAYLARLAYIKKSHGLDYVIPSLDAELPIFIRYADRLKELGIQTFLPDMNRFRLRGKDKLVQIAENVGLRIPRTAVLTSEEMLFGALARIGTPLMVKGIYYEAHRANTRTEAILQYRKLVAQWGYPIVAQEIVNGDELNVIGLGDGEGNSLGLLGMKKIALTSLGKVWSGVTVDHPAMMRAARQFVEKHHWKGPFELECIISDDDIHLIEINPRFPAWVYFATACGVNLPATMLRHSLGMRRKPLACYEPGKLLVRYSYDYVADMNTFQHLVTSGETQ
jgi:carbamoyl-phosphate synthase large subunit